MISRQNILRSSHPHFTFMFAYTLVLLPPSIFEEKDIDKSHLPNFFFISISAFRYSIHYWRPSFGNDSSSSENSCYLSPYYHSHALATATYFYLNHSPTFPRQGKFTILNWLNHRPMTLSCGPRINPYPMLLSMLPLVLLVQSYAFPRKIHVARAIMHCGMWIM